MKGASEACANIMWRGVDPCEYGENVISRP